MVGYKTVRKVYLFLDLKELPVNITFNKPTFQLRLKVSPKTLKTPPKTGIV